LDPFALQRPFWIIAQADPVARRVKGSIPWRAGSGHTGRLLRRALIAIALAALSAGGVAWASGNPAIAHWVWAAGAVPVIGGLVVSIVRDLLAGRLGVDAVALLSMIGALALRENLAAIVVAVMYAGGNALEEFAVSRAERDLKSLIDRAPRIAHRETAGQVGDIPVADVAIGDRLLVRAGEVVPVDGILADSDAVLDESALTGEPIPVTRRQSEAVRSGAVNAGQTFSLQATTTEGESTYAGIVRMATATQTAKAPTIRMADRFALLLLPVSLALAGIAWGSSGDPVRGLAVLVTATPCPLILAAPVAYIAGVARAARRGILMKGGLALEALARTRTVIFDKTGTLTVGGARMLRIETAPGWSIDETLRVIGSLEQASQHPVAAAIVAAAHERHLGLDTPTDVREAMGSGLEGEVSGRRVRAGAHGFVFGSSPANPWARRILRQASFRSALAVFVVVDGAPAGAIPACRSVAPRGAARHPGPANLWRFADRHAYGRPRGDCGGDRSRARYRFGPFGSRRSRSSKSSSQLSWSVMASTTPPPSPRRMSVWRWARGARAHRLKPPMSSSWSMR
jgi:cation transport ATPase